MEQAPQIMAAAAAAATDASDDLSVLSDTMSFFSTAVPSRRASIQLVIDFAATLPEGAQIPQRPHGDVLPRVGRRVGSTHLARLTERIRVIHRRCTIETHCTGTFVNVLSLVTSSRSDFAKPISTASGIFSDLLLPLDHARSKRLAAGRLVIIKTTLFELCAPNPDVDQGDERLR
jgi:hypothetical protein